MNFHFAKGGPCVWHPGAAIRRAPALGVGHLADEEASAVGRSGRLHPAIRGSYFRAHGVNATFVGHPLFDELPRSWHEPPAPFPAQAPVIGLLPGSRRAEAEANFPGLLDAGEQIRQAFPEAALLVPTTPTQPVVEREVGRRGTTNLTVGVDQFDQMVPRCDLCLTVSGTATLHVASFGVPMLVVYRVSPLAWNLAGRWLVPTRTFALVNLLAARNPTDQTQPAGPIISFPSSSLGMAQVSRCADCAGITASSRATGHPARKTSPTDADSGSPRRLRQHRPARAGHDRPYRLDREPVGATSCSPPPAPRVPTPVGANLVFARYSVREQG